MALLERHLAFIEALREAGVPVSLAEDLDSVVAVEQVGLGDRETLRAGLAATLLKRQTHRGLFDAIFDLYFPALVGSGWRGGPLDGSEPAPPADAAPERGADDALAELRQAMADALADGDQDAIRLLVREAVEQYGAMPGRGEGLSSWSSYNTVQQLSLDGLVLRVARALMEGSDDRDPRSEEVSMLTAANRVASLQRQVEADVRRRIAEEKDPDHVARTTLRPSLDQLPFLNARRDDLEELRRQIYPLARRLATRLAREQHARRRGPLDFRRTIRASMATGGVPITTHHRPRRPHRTELVVLCDVSGSVANFASFTLLLVYALREQFTKVRAFTFVDDIREVTDDFVPGADPAETMLRLAESARHASRWGRTNYGRALSRFVEDHPDAVGPRTSLLVLGDARSNYSDPGLEVLRELVATARHAWWLNPEHRRQWGTGDSAAPEYAEMIDMVECRNLTQLSEFVHDLV
ncbi:vWA domain-containing protein [Nocardioides marmoribigeumensis]|uniref:Uncharacterized protein with von Willebrand factor type A (VWA) domain n=1 Tax=Nocardioides marmoribigeumensis TaxID=433649 RepID=A0ABU2BSN6_9ACTN|nr:VWA domain-containing protein [Nocardioides marmoribigeumensis]MDR7361004.1 uncharacterized protein with von Willebrand factor type A (vWA) domain [Nocardioides marmoribigeumensis]